MAIDTLPSPTAAEVEAMSRRGESGAAIAAAQAALPTLQGGDRTPMLLALSAAWASAGNAMESLRSAVAAGEAARTAGDRTGSCDALLRVATAQRLVGDYAGALGTLEQAEDLARLTGDTLRRAEVLRQIGVCSSIVGRHQHAISCLAEADALLQAADLQAERIGTRLSLYNARSRRAHTLPEEAPERRQELAALMTGFARLAQDCGVHQRQVTEVMALGNHAINQHALGCHREAIAELEALLPRYRALQLKPNEGLCLAELGRCHQALGEMAAARERLLQALVPLEEAGTLQDLTGAYESLSAVEEALGHAAPALAALRRVRELEKRQSAEAARTALVQRELRIELARLTSQWALAATRDPLTGLANRRGLDQWMSDRLPKAEAGAPLALVLMDLDHFKQVNDRFGHDIGDEVLRRVGLLVQAACRAEDLAVRYGGEEFLIALASHDAHPLAERLRETVAAHRWDEISAGLQVTLSVGIASVAESLEPAALLALADKRLYAAKYGGRNRVVAAD